MRTRPGSSWTIWQTFALSRLSPNIFGNLKFVVEYQAVASPGSDSADQPSQYTGQFCRSSRSKPVPVPKGQTIHSLQESEQFRLCKLVRMVPDQQASRCQIHLNRFDFGRAAQQVTPYESPFPLHMIDLLNSREVKSQPSGQPMNDPGT